MQYQGLLNMAIGAVFMAAAVLQIRKMITIPVSVRYNGDGNSKKMIALLLWEVYKTS